MNPLPAWIPSAEEKSGTSSKKAKKNRVILLTTHSMEEADILGDKIAIMARGALRCVGSALHLKQKFGAGYRVTLGTSEAMVPTVKKFVEDNIKGVKLSSPPISGYMNFGVPRESTAELAPFFRLLDTQRQQLHIVDCQLSITTLEEVFLTIAEGAEEAEKMAQLIAEGQKSMSPMDEEDIAPVEIVEKKASIEEKLERREIDRLSRRDQFDALFRKTATLQMRDKKTNICQALTPFVFIGILVFFNWMLNHVRTSYPVDENRFPINSTRFHVLNYPLGIAETDFYQPSNPILQDISRHGTQLVYMGDLDLEEFLHWNNASRSPIKFMRRDRAQYTEATFKGPSLQLPISAKKFESKSDMDDYVFSAHNDLPSIVGGYRFELMEPGSSTYKFSVLYNYTLTLGEDVPYLLNQITDAIAKQSEKPFSIKLKAIKLMPNEASPGLALDVLAIGGSITYVLILQQLLPVFVVNIVSEKEGRIKELMKMTGLHMHLYWAVHYMVDYLMYLVLAFFLPLAGAIFQVRFYLYNNFGVYILLFLEWGHVLIASSFVMSVFFSRKKSSVVVGYVIIIVIALTCFVLIESLIGGDLDTVNPVTRFCLSLFPPFALYRGLMYLSAEVEQEGYGMSLSDVSNNATNMREIYCMLLVQWAVLMTLWWYLEQVVPSNFGVPKHPLFFLGFGKKANHENTERPVNVGEDVNREFDLAYDDAKSSDFAIQARNLTQVFKGLDRREPKVAVDKAAFVLEKSTCLGILGHNGAGKTTLISLLIGLIPTRSGTAKIYGRDLIQDLPKIHTLMGVCQQYDILWETLTAQEHLLFYGRIRNLKGAELKRQVASALKKVNLYQVRNIQAGRYSGGMKRRLSVAIAILGTPPVIYLDEPSTGLDPKSRQELWQVINEVKKESAILMTTHSMEEAEAICDKLTVMINGSIKALGGSSDLKNRFGEGFNLSIQVAKGHDQGPADKFMREIAPGAVLVNELSGTRNYQAPRGSFTLDVLFEQMEQKKDQLHITDWAVTNTTLEEVFLKISQTHRHKVEVITEAKSEEPSKMSIHLPQLPPQIESLVDYGKQLPDSEDEDSQDEGRGPQLESDLPPPPPEPESDVEDKTVIPESDEVEDDVSFMSYKTSMEFMPEKDMTPMQPAMKLTTMSDIDSDEEDPATMFSGPTSTSVSAASYPTLASMHSHASTIPHNEVSMKLDE
eukprot:TRINITY_DN4639_c1_g1_i1.p1 TRINITY_DN4639_c1_g1~~TRINITY_DN4639_c1_g1_i1.p1  ORF type:complete len:1195 (-),score=473.31 TRINITY_DN4639_c1_g1_i1:27-3611(-)